jgi:hypothetical protein
MRRPFFFFASVSYSNVILIVPIAYPSLGSLTSPSIPWFSFSPLLRHGGSTLTTAWLESYGAMARYIFVQWLWQTLWTSWPIGRVFVLIDMSGSADSLQTFPSPIKASLSRLASCISVTMVSRLCLNIQRPPPPAEFTSVPAISIDYLGRSHIHISDNRPLTWESDITMTDLSGLGSNSRMDDMESNGAHSAAHSTDGYQSPELEEWGVYSKWISEQVR